MTADPNNVALDLVDAHREQDPGIEATYFCFDSDAAEIQLVEVSESAAESGKVVPFRFAEQEDVPFKTVLVVVSPDEWEKLHADGGLEWPDGLQPLEDFEKIGSAGVSHRATAVRDLR